MNPWYKEREYLAWLIVLVLVTLAVVIGIVMIEDNFDMNKEKLLEVELAKFEGELYSILSTYEQFSNYIAEQIVNDARITKIIYEANSISDSKRKAELRQELLGIVGDDYSYIGNYEFREPHFHLADNESFLRVYEPDLYGDDLTETRISVRQANERQEYSKGFEEGTVFNGFRYVYPVFYQNIHCGSVEVSISSTSILKILSELYPEKEYHFVINSAYGDGVKLEEERFKVDGDLRVCEYYFDLDTGKKGKGKDKIITDGCDNHFQNIMNNYQGRLGDKESFAAICSCDIANHLVKFVSIRSMSDRSTAYMVSMATSSDVAYEYMLKAKHKWAIATVASAIVVVISTLWIANYQFQLRMHAHIDYLTQIYNRNKFMELALVEIKRARRHKYKIGVLIIDIDFFKKINDTYGHDVGDQVLYALAKHIGKVIRSEDIFARWGGEEFLILMPHIKNNEELFKAGEKVRLAISDNSAEELMDITISVGATLLEAREATQDLGGFEIENRDQEDLMAAIKLADGAMYEAKQTGRNKVVVKK